MDRNSWHLHDPAHLFDKGGALRNAIAAYASLNGLQLAEGLAKAVLPELVRAGLLNDEDQEGVRDQINAKARNKSTASPRKPRTIKPAQRPVEHPESAGGRNAQ